MSLQVSWSKGNIIRSLTSLENIFLFVWEGMIEGHVLLVLSIVNTLMYENHGR